MATETQIDHAACRAALNAMYESAVEIMDDPPEIGTMRFWFDSRLGSFGHAYYKEGWEEFLRERDRLYAMVKRLADEIEGEGMKSWAADIRKELEAVDGSR